jgi:hypothetical protein
MQVPSKKTKQKKQKNKKPEVAAFDYKKTLIHLSLIRGGCVPIKQIKPNVIITISINKLKFEILLLLLLDSYL